MSELSNIVKTGTVTVHPDGSVHVEGFEVDFVDGPPDFSGCQYVFNVGACWALQRIAFALTTEGFFKGGVD